MRAIEVSLLEESLGFGVDPRRQDILPHKADLNLALYQELGADKE